MSSQSATMADLDSSLQTTPEQSLSSSSSSSWFGTLNLKIYHRAIFFFILVALLPLFPSQPPEPLNKSLFSRGWELLRLLLVGIAISYGLFSRRNADVDTDDKDHPNVPQQKADVSPHSYVAGILDVSSVFDDDDNYADSAAAAASAEPCPNEQTKTTQAWSSQYYPGEPAVMVAGDVSGKPLSLPVRRLRASFDEENKDSVVLPSPIPWRSRSGRMMEVNEEVFNCSTATSPPSPELRVKTGEDLSKKKSLHKFATLPPPPPPPPPPPVIHGYSSYTDRRDYGSRSFKEELKDHSRIGGVEFIQSRSVRTLRQKENGSNERSIKMESETALENGFTEKKAAESRPPPPLKSKSVQAPIETSMKKNGFREKMIIYSDDSESDTDAHEEETSEAAEASPTGTAGKSAQSPPPPPPLPAADDNEVDKKADEFIAKFREQIRLQRIQSIKRSAGQRSPK